MTTRTVAAMFRSRTDAEGAEQQMVNELNIDRMHARTSPALDVKDAGYDSSRPYEETGFFGALKNLSLPEEDRYIYSEGMRRGHVLVTAQVDDSQVSRAVAILESAGALDLDAETANWRQSGWTEYNASTHGATTRRASLTDASASGVSTAGAGTTANAGARAATLSGRDEEVIPLVEEELEVGKRSVERRVQVRTHVVERPVEAEVNLRDESVRVERRQVNRPAAELGRDAFTERVVEVTETDEVPVVSKTARVVEEVVVHKDVGERTETVRDTVRRTEVDVDGDANPGRGTGGMSAGAMNRAAEASYGRTASHTVGNSITGDPGNSPPDGTPGNPPGTMASRAVDKTLGTNISGANPAGESALGTRDHSSGTVNRATSGTHSSGDIPDGAPGNPPGTMASRAVDKTLGTNVSGANPGKTKR